MTNIGNSRVDVISVVQVREHLFSVPVVHERKNKKEIDVNDDCRLTHYLYSRQFTRVSCPLGFR